MREQRLRTIPRISVNKLAEYMLASPSRRRGIIRDQKQPLDFVVARYTPVYEAVAISLVAGGDIGPIRERLKTLYDATPDTVWKAQDMQLSVEALEAFLDFVDEIDLSGFDVSRAPDPSRLMDMGGVELSVRPELHLRDKSGSIAGLLKIYISKTHPLDDEAAQYAGTVVHQYASEVLGNGKPLDHRQCFVVDLFARTVHVAPRAFKRRRENLLAACEEIAHRWPAV